MTPDAREWAREIVTVESDAGGWWRVALACGDQRATVVALCVKSACEAYRDWIADKILAPALDAAYARGVEEGEYIGAANAWDAAASLADSGTPTEGIGVIAKRNAAGLRALTGRREGGTDDVR